MPEVVAVESGPQGRASASWDILQQPSPEEALGEPEAQAERPEAARESPDSSSTEQEPAKEAPEGEGQEQQQESEEPRGEHKEKLSRYERTKRQKKALERREAELSRREQAFADAERARVAQEQAANKPPYTLEELRKYRKSWEKDGAYDLVERADAEIARLEKLEAESKSVVEIPKAGSPEFTKQWEGAEAELYRLDPEFQREGTRLDKVLRSMMSGPDGAIYRQHPRGIVAAYHRARLDIAEADLGAARGEIAKLKNEVARLNGLTSVGASGGAGRSVADMRGKDFASMSTREMREYLKRNATRGHW